MFYLREDEIKNYLFARILKNFIRVFFLFTLIFNLQYFQCRFILLSRFIQTHDNKYIKDLFLFYAAALNFFFNFTEGKIKAQKNIRSFYSAIKSINFSYISKKKF